MKFAGSVKCALSLAVFAILTAGGCGPTCPKTAISRAQLVKEYNANAAAVPRLKARARIALTLTDAKGQQISWGSVSPVASPNGLLILAKGSAASEGDDFALIGRMPGGTELFRMGVSCQEDLYYLWYNFGDHHGAMWGRLELAGAERVDIPLDPTQLLSVLCVTAIPDNFKDLPTVVMSFSENPCAYVLTFVDRQPVSGNILFRKEVYFRWDDKLPRQPFMVRLFDNSGRRIMTASLKNYKPVTISLEQNSPPPVMPTDIEIIWPERKSSIHILLSDMTTAEDWDRRQLLFAPNLPRTISLEDVVQVDKEATSEGSTR